MPELQSTRLSSRYFNRWLKARFCNAPALPDKEKSPVFHTVEPAGGASERQKMTVGSGAASIRPYVVCAVLRGVTFDAKSYKSFMDLQVSFPPTPTPDPPAPPSIFRIRAALGSCSIKSRRDIGALS